MALHQVPSARALLVSARPEEVSRRFMGRRPAYVLVVAAMLLTTGCGEYDAVQVCATRTDPPVRADDHYCDAPASPQEAQAYGLYTVQLPDDDSSVVIVGIGHPVYPPGTRPIGSFAPPRNGTIVRAPSSSVGQPGTISRGGFGGGYSGGSAGS